MRLATTFLALAVGLWAPAQAQAPASHDELLTAASLEKLKTITLSASKTSNLDAPVVKMLGIGKDGDQIAVKQFRAETTLGLYVLTIPVKPATDDVVFSFRDPSGVTYNYLSNSTRTLRAAMAADADGSRMLKNEDAEEGFRSVLKAWGLIAPRVKAP
jgi:hypothetical protein